MNRASFLICVLLLAACAGPAGPSEPRAIATATASGILDGTDWSLTSLRGQPLLPGTAISLEFGADMYGGSAGCNRYEGEFVAMDDGNLKQPVIQATAMQCAEPEGVMVSASAKRRRYLDMHGLGSGLITVWTVIVCLSLAGCGSLPGRSGILAEETSQGASLDDLTSSLNALLESQEPDTFAGLWIQEQPYYRVFVAFTRDGERTVKRYVAGTPLDGLVEVRGARFTSAELLAAGQAVGRLTQELGFPFQWVADVPGNRIELWVTDLAQFETALTEARRPLPEPVEMVVTYEPLGTTPVGPMSVPGVAFPQISARTSEDLLIDLTGRLVAKDDCLRVVPGGEEAGYLIIWQPDYFLNDGQGTLEVWDRDGVAVARVGQEITLGLAGLPGDSQVEAYLREPLPVQCPGPYWLMSRIVQ